MDTKRRAMSGQPWQVVLLLVLFVWLMPQTAAARWIEESYNYSATLNGANTIRLSVPCFNENGNNMWILDGNHYTVNAVWPLPYNILGKTLKFSWDVTRDGHGYSSQKVTGLNDFEITIPQAQDVVYPQVTAATLSYSVAGKIEILWFMASTKIESARYKYYDAAGSLQKVNMTTDANSGTIYQDASVSHKDFHLVINYWDNSNYKIDNVSSTTQDLAMIHYRRRRLARPQITRGKRWRRRTTCSPSRSWMPAPKLLNLSRPYVNSNIEVYVDRGTSPIRLAEND